MYEHMYRMRINCKFKGVNGIGFCFYSFQGKAIEGDKGAGCTATTAGGMIDLNVIQPNP